MTSFDGVTGLGYDLGLLHLTRQLRDGAPAFAHSPASPGSVSSFVADEWPARVPAPFPTVLTAERKASVGAGGYRSNSYAVPPELTGAMVPVAHRLSALTLTSPSGRPPADWDGRGPSPAGCPGGAGTGRDSVHVTALQALPWPARHHRSQRGASSAPRQPCRPRGINSLRNETIVIGPCRVVMHWAAYDCVARGSPQVTDTEAIRSQSGSYPVRASPDDSTPP